MKKRMITVFAVLAMTANVYSTNYYCLPPGTPGVVAEPDYLSWATAGTNIYEAAKKAFTDNRTAGRYQTRQTLYVKSGVYELDHQLSIPDQMGTMRSSKGIVDAEDLTNEIDPTNTVLFAVHGTNRLVKISCASVTRDFIFRGFTLTNGFANASAGGGNGGGVHIDLSYVSDTQYLDPYGAGGVYDCRFFNCSTYTHSGGGGAIYAPGSACCVSNCWIDSCVMTNVCVSGQDNGTTGGSAIRIGPNGTHTGSKVTAYNNRLAHRILDCTFTNCYARGNALRGGVIAPTGLAKIYVGNCRFYNNRASNVNGGNMGINSACYLYKGGMAENCEFVDNNTGGNLYLDWAGTAKNCTVRGNSYFVAFGDGNQTWGGATHYGTNYVIGCTFETDSTSGHRIDLGGRAHLLNCRFRGGSTSTGNNGAFIGWNSLAKVDNCLFVDVPKPLYCSASSVGTINNCVFVGITQLVHYDASITADKGLTFVKCISNTKNGTGTRTADFAQSYIKTREEMKFIDAANDDYRFRADAIDAIDNGAEVDWTGIVKTDIRGRDRVVNGHIDVGPFERQPDDKDKLLATVSSVEAWVDGDGASVSAAVEYPSDATIQYSTDGGTTWSEENPVFTALGVHPVKVKVTSSIAEDFYADVEVNIRDYSSDNDGKNFFVVPSGSTPTAPYSTWETAANDLQSAATAAASLGGAARIFVAPGDYTVASQLTLSNATIKCVNPATYAVVPNGAVFDAQAGSDESRRVASIANGRYYGLVFKGGHIRNNAEDTEMSGAGVYVSANTDISEPMFTDCSFRGNKVEKTDNNNVKSCYGGGMRLANSVMAKFRRCTWADNRLESAAASNNTGGGSARGAGVCQFTGGSLYFYDCLFTNNVASAATGGGRAAYGAGLHMDSSCCGYIDNCDFIGNKTLNPAGSAPYGSAIYINNGPNSKVLNSRFIKNTTAGFGIVVLNQRSGTVISNCVFAANSFGNGTDGGMVETTWNCVFTNNYGNIFYSGSNSRIRNCLFANNDNICWHHQSDGRVLGFDNCTFVGNAGILNIHNNANSGRGARFNNCIIYGNTTDFSIGKQSVNNVFGATNCIFDKQATIDVLTSASNVSLCAGPRFKDAANGDYSLKTGSAAREKGAVLSWMNATSVDLAGKPRLVDRQGLPLSENPAALPDLGCYECQERSPGFVVIIR